MIKSANLTGSVSRNSGGLFESVRRLVKSLKAEDLEICVFGTEDEHTAADIGQWAPVPVKVFRPWGPHQFGYSSQYRKSLFEFKPDLVHTHGLWTFCSIATNQYRRRRGVPYLISGHGMLDPWAVRHSRWKKVAAYIFYEGAHLREASCLRALCESEARAIRELGFKNPICIIPNGIDLPIIPNAEMLKPETLKLESGSQTAEGGNNPTEIGSQNFRFQVSASQHVSPPWAGMIEPGKKVLLFLSRIHPKKGLVNLLRAWATCHSPPVTRHSEWVLAIAGWDQGGHEAELKQLCGELNIPWADVREQKSEIGNRKSEIISAFSFQNVSVLFLGPQFKENKAACYAQCDGFILPSFSEGVPMVVLEAWVNGKPVVMTPECNLPAGFARGAAIRIETDVASIARGLEEFFRLSAADRATLGANGERLAREQFAWPQLAREMRGVYEWMLGGGSPPGCVV
jgi:poly(glycerol-phosphate) alpha-glucosyltransferase